MNKITVEYVVGKTDTRANLQATLPSGKTAGIHIHRPGRLEPAKVWMPTISRRWGDASGFLSPEDTVAVAALMAAAAELVADWDHLGNFTAAKWITKEL